MQHWGLLGSWRTGSPPAPCRWHNQEVSSSRASRLSMVKRSQLLGCFFFCKASFFSKEFCCSRLTKYFYLTTGVLFGRGSLFFFSFQLGPIRCALRALLLQRYLSSRDCNLSLNKTNSFVIYTSPRSIPKQPGSLALPFPANRCLLILQSISCERMALSTQSSMCRLSND